MLRLIIWGLLFYFIAKVIKNVAASLTETKRKNKVGSTNEQQKPPLDLRSQDVEDADFEDIT